MKRSQLRLRYWRIVFFFGRVTANVIFWDIFLPRIGLRALERPQPLRALPPHRGALPGARHPHGRADDQGRAVPLGTTGRAAARDHRRARRPAGRGARRGLRRHPRAGRGRAGRAARRALRVGRRDPDGRRVAGPGASGEAVRSRGGRCTGSRTWSSRSSARTSSRSWTSTSRRCAGWAVGCSGTSPSASGPTSARWSRSSRAPRWRRSTTSPRATTPRPSPRPSRTTRASTSRAWSGASRTRRVLTLENVAAIKIGDYEAITAAGIDRSRGRLACCWTPTCRDPRGRLLPRRPAPRQPVRHPAGRDRTRTATAGGS